MKTARKLGCDDGEYWIGRTYVEGWGVPVDYKKALHWLDIAVADGNPHAMTSLAIMYTQGNGVEVDDERAVKLFLKGAEGGCPGAKLNLADRYRVGKGLPLDIEKSKALYKELSDEGDKRATKALEALGESN